MTDKRDLPVFAVVGHPNEGKSSVVSTLTEDDSVRIDAVPGTTVVCEDYPVVIDGVEILRFTDTPGFQSPKKTLDWFNNFTAGGEGVTDAFIAAHRANSDFRDECELLSPIVRGAGIIYVVDGSRPVRSEDRAEMEILRLTGRPRMAIVNCKEDEQTHLESWKSELRKQFNIVRVFNAHRATYRERIALLESLKSIDQDWQAALESVITAFKSDWNSRNVQSAHLIADMLVESIRYRVTKTFPDEASLMTGEKDLKRQYREHIERLERRVHEKIRRRFKHNIFDVDLPADSIVMKDLFDRRTWQVLGLTTRQLALAAGIAGGVLGGVIDTAAAGLSFGIFTAIGGIAGAGSAVLGVSRMAKAKVVGVNLGGIQLQVGPNENVQFPYVLLDRALIFYAQVINWAHGRRRTGESDGVSAAGPGSKAGYTSRWNEKTRYRLGGVFQGIRKNTCSAESVRQFTDMIKKALDDISGVER